MNLSALLDPLAIVALLSLAGVFPWMGLWEHRRLVRWSAEGLPEARMRHYNWIMVWEWTTIAVLLPWWFLTGRGAAQLRLVSDPSGWQWAAIGVGLLLGALLVVQMITTIKNAKSLEKLSGQLGRLEDMVPRNSKEARAFDWLSVTAGICEEIMYRGVLLVLLAAAIGTWPAVLVSSAIFGLGHIYQGPLGYVKTSAVGLALALLTVLSGSLIPAILLHAILDLTSGRLMCASVSITGSKPTAV